jgi:hypothetical protein
MLSPVRGTEGIVNVHVEGSSELLGELLVVLLLLGVETNVLEKANLAARQVRVRQTMEYEKERSTRIAR